MLIKFQRWYSVRNEVLFLQGSDDESDSSDDDEPDPAAKRREPNKFDNLCDGVLNAMALVHTALAEVGTFYTITSKSVFDYKHLQNFMHVHIEDLNMTFQHYKLSLALE